MPEKVRQKKLEKTREMNNKLSMKVSFFLIMPEGRREVSVLRPRSRRNAYVLWRLERLTVTETWIVFCSNIIRALSFPYTRQCVIGWGGTLPALFAVFLDIAGIWHALTPAVGWLLALLFTSILRAASWIVDTLGDFDLYDIIKEKILYLMR
jgi:hypothetical protein